MHLLDTYATSTGSKINKPFIYASYFPIPTGKYVTFQAQTKFDSKDYAYWQDVITIMYPILQKLGISIIQIGIATEKQYQYTIDYRGKTTMNQLAYVIQNASLHFGSDSLGVHLASGFDIPIVALYSISQKTVSGPKFGTPEKQTIIESFLRVGNKKPSYSMQENPKSVNLIKPEEIANAIFAQLGVEFQVPFETVYTGHRYGFEKVRDFIPNQVVNLTNPQVPVEIRMDVEFNEDVLFKQLSLGKAVIITDKPINLELLKRFKPNIHTLIYEVKENDHPDFIVAVKKMGVPLAVVSYLSKEKLDVKKINYYEHGRIAPIEYEKQEKIEELRKDVDSLYYRSNKIMLSNNKFYASDAARMNGIEIQSDFDFQKVIDTPEFWQELCYMHIIKKLDKPATIS